MSNPLPQMNVMKADNGIILSSSEGTSVFTNPLDAMETVGQFLGLEATPNAVRTATKKAEKEEEQKSNDADDAPDREALVSTIKELGILKKVAKKYTCEQLQDMIDKHLAAQDEDEMTSPPDEDEDLFAGKETSDAKEPERIPEYDGPEFSVKKINDDSSKKDFANCAKDFSDIERLRVLVRIHARYHTAKHTKQVMAHFGVNKIGEDLTPDDSRVAELAHALAGQLEV